MPQRLPLGVGGDRELGGGLRGAEPAGGLHAGQHLRAVGGAEGAGGRLRQWGRRKCPPPPPRRRRRRRRRRRPGGRWGVGGMSGGGGLWGAMGG